jgi:hypothetical protein
VDGQKRTRSCIRRPQSRGQVAPQGCQQICIPVTRDSYDCIWNDAREVRRDLELLIQTMPELFPRADRHAKRASCLAYVFKQEAGQSFAAMVRMNAKSFDQPQLISQNDQSKTDGTAPVTPADWSRRAAIPDSLVLKSQLENGLAGNCERVT